MPDDLVLGVSAYYHDSAAALVRGGRILAAAQEERFTRKRHDRGFPSHAVAFCLEHAGVSLSDLAAVAYYEDPALKFRRVMASYLGAAPRGFRGFSETFPGWVGRKRRAAREVARELARLGRGTVPPVLTRRHHESHAASAFYPSPFSSAAVLCVDGVGEWATTSLWHGQGERLALIGEVNFPHSLGMMYSAFTYFCGFKVDSGEYKLMGLAPYGTPRYAQTIRDHLIDIKADGSFRLNMDYFSYLRGETMTDAKFEQLFGGSRRTPEAKLTQREFDLAASVQVVLEDVLLLMARTARRATGEARLCLAGGVSLNCVANGRILREELFESIWVQPAAGDAGGALGAALAVAMDSGARREHVERKSDAMRGALLGPAYDDDEIKAFLDKERLPYVELSDDELARQTAEQLASGNVVGWFQDRMEFGPRALGARSILGDPQNPEMQSMMNLKIKFRESFRPFAPAVLESDASQYFEITSPSPYMLMVAPVAEKQRVPIPADSSSATGMDLLRIRRSTIPAVTHVDYSARIQTVTGEVNPRFERLLREFKNITGCPVVVNTSFNVRGEPIVRTMEEAYTCFMRTGIDILVLGRFMLAKADQPEWAETGDWRQEIPLD